MGSRARIAVVTVVAIEPPTERGVGLTPVCSGFTAASA
jgi:hypothetical protein